MHFVVYGRWDHGSPVGEDVETRFASAFRPTDASVCVWTDLEDQHLLRVAFDVDAASLEEAVDVGRAELWDGGHRVALGGSLTEVVSMTDEGYRTWSA